MAKDSSYGQYCPISHALDVLGARWTLMIVRDLLVGTTRFNDLSRGLPGLSRSLLTKRLRELEQANLVERLDGEYLLTEAGRDLEPIVFGFGAWGGALGLR
jgi:DNA-binding HxlR family transcriptional regulator